MATIGVAALSCFYRPTRRLIKNLANSTKNPCWVHQNVLVDFLNGAVIVPLCVLIGACFSKELLDEVVKTEKVFLAIAGVAALLFVLKEYGKE
jgi:hypothetical protein